MWVGWRVRSATWCSLLFCRISVDRCMPWLFLLFITTSRLVTATRAGWWWTPLAFFLVMGRLGFLSVFLSSLRSIRVKWSWSTATPWPSLLSLLLLSSWSIWWRWGRRTSSLSLLLLFCTFTLLGLFALFVFVLDFINDFLSLNFRGDCFLLFLF